MIVCQGCLATRRYLSDARKYPSELIGCCLVSHALSGRYGKADGYLLSRLRDLLNLTRSLKPSLIPGYGDSPLSVYDVSCSEHCARLGALASSCQPVCRL